MKIPNDVDALKGRQQAPEQFKIDHTGGNIEPEILRRLLNGDAVALHIRGYLKPKQAQSLSQAFRLLVQRPRTDNGV